LTSNPLFWSLRAIARMERRGDIRGPRLTELGHERWHRVAGALGYVDFIRLLHEDLAVAFPIGFDLAAWSGSPWAGIDDERARAWVTEASQVDTQSPQSFLRQACLALGLPSAGSVSKHQKVQAHHRVVELPGTGGRVGLQQALEHGVSLDRSFTFVVANDAERVAVGIAVLEARANPPAVWSPETLEVEMARGHQFDAAFAIEDWDPAVSAASKIGGEVRWT
jgi:hypothetical protein